MIKQATVIVLVFLLGVLAATALTSMAGPEKDLKLPENNADGGYEFSEPTTLQRVLGIETQAIKPSYPGDRISEDQILVSKERVLLNVKGATWATFTDTHSMEPVLSAKSNAIEVAPESEKDLDVGDIVAYESEYADGLIIHRIVYKGKDENGTYFILKGDNNPTSDPGRIRFSQIKSVVVAIIY